MARTILQEVKYLNAGWRNFLCEHMGLDDKTFQLAQGNLTLETTNNSGLFRMADAVPPLSPVGLYDASSMQKRSDAYSLLLNALKSDTDPDGLIKALGPDYKKWKKWQKSNPAVEKESYLNYYKRWAFSNTTPGRRSAGEIAIRKANNDGLRRALYKLDLEKYKQSFQEAGQDAYSLPIYSATSNAANNAIQNGKSLRNIWFDSDHMNIYVDKGIASDTTSNTQRYIIGNPEKPDKQIQKEAANGGFTIKGYINKYATLPSSPGGWYDSGQVLRAYNNKGNENVWVDGTDKGVWEYYFGKKGALSRYVSEFILISDYEIRVTSKAKFRMEEVEKITAEEKVSAWPMFNTRATADNAGCTLNDRGQLEMVYTLNKGLIQILGVSVQTM